MLSAFFVVLILAVSQKIRNFARARLPYVNDSRELLHVFYCIN